MKHLQTKYNFSLIELLVTISVIAILAGLLLPALNSARAKAQAINCVSNLKQISTGVLMYFNDYDYQLAVQDDGGSYWSRNSVYFRISEYIGGSKHETLNKLDNLGRDKLTPKVLICPSITANTIPASLSGQTKSAGPYKSDAAYGFIYPYPSNKGMSFKTLKWSTQDSKESFSPDKVLICGDNAWYAENRRGAIQLTSGWNGVIWSLPYMRHSKRGNFIGLDGGVRTLSSSEMIKSYSLAGRYSDGNHYAIKIALCVK